MSYLFPRQQRSFYVVGDLSLVSSSTPYLALQELNFTAITFKLGTAPAGSGSTVVNVIKNGDVSDILYSATFNAGDTQVTSTTRTTTSVNDELSINISSLASGYGGADLIIAMDYYTKGF